MRYRKARFIRVPGTVFLIERRGEDKVRILTSEIEARRRLHLRIVDAFPCVCFGIGSGQGRFPYAPVFESITMGQPRGGRGLLHPRIFRIVRVIPFVGGVDLGFDFVDQCRTPERERAGFSGRKVEPRLRNRNFLV